MKKSQRCIHHLRFIQHPSVLLNFIQCLLNAKCRTVGPVGRHGFDNISNGKYLCLTDDTVSGETRRISRTVYSFTALQNSYPFIPGIQTSLMMRWGRDSMRA